MPRPRRRQIKKPPPRIHDRQATELPINAMVRPVEVADPYERGATVIAIQNLRDDPLARLHARGQIPLHIFNAGREMQGYYERAEIGAVKAMDPTKEPVDGGGGIPETVTEAVQRAVKAIERVDEKLGKEGAALIRAVLSQGLFVHQIMNLRWGGVESAENRYISRRFHECMNTIAEELGYISRGSPSAPTRT